MKNLWSLNMAIENPRYFGFFLGKVYRNQWVLFQPCLMTRYGKVPGESQVASLVESPASFAVTTIQPLPDFQVPQSLIHVCWNYPLVMTNIALENGDL